MRESSSYSSVLWLIGTTALFILRSIKIYFWMPVDEKYDAFDCEVCDAMVSKPCRKCPKCGAEYIGVYTFTDTIMTLDEYEEIYKLP